MFKLLISNLKMTFRNRQAIFWTLIFPLMFIVIFGLFNFDQVGNSKIVLIDQAKSIESGQFAEALSKIEFLKINKEISDEAMAKAQLKEGKIDFILILPKEFSLAGQLSPQATGPASKVPIKIYYDQSNLTVNQLVIGVLGQFLDKLNLQIQGGQELFSLEKEGIQSKNIKYLDLLMPGILGMSVMTASVIGLSTQISKYREQKLLKRLQATPLRVRNFLAAEVSNYLVIAILQVSLIILVSRLLFKVHVFGSYFLIYLLAIFGSLIFLNIGFAIGSYAKSTNAAEALANIVTMPMMFFSGVFFSAEALPKVVYKIVQFLPLTPLVDALREVSINEAGLGDIRNKLLFLTGWIVVSFLLAWKTFRFKN